MRKYVRTHVYSGLAGWVGGFTCTTSISLELSDEGMNVTLNVISSLLHTDSLCAGAVG